jgi:hypothetical protein
VDALTPRELEALAHDRPGPCVSIFMPVYRGGAEAHQNRIRLRNLLRDAELKLVGMNHTEELAEELLSPIRERLSDNEYWLERAEGLALLRSQDTFHWYRLPAPVPELVVVTERFHLKPILPLFMTGERFYVLTLSQNEAKLYEADRTSIVAVDSVDLPRSLADALRHDDVSNVDHFYPGSQGRQAGGISPVAGHGAGKGDDKRQPHDELLRYFRKIDAALHDTLSNQRVPLVLAGVEHHFPIYRSVNTYPHLMEEGLAGTPGHVPPDELRERARPIVASFFQRAEREEFERFRTYAGNLPRQVATNLEAIVVAAHHGRVATLFVADEAVQWGTFDVETGKVHLHTEAEVGDQDLLNLTALRTITHGGKVFAVPGADVPSNGSHDPAAAILRY